MNTKKGFTLTAENQKKLNDALAAYRQAESHGFTSDLEKGKILYEVQLMLGSDDTAEKYWTSWVRNEVGLQRRTAQRYRDLYKNYYAARPEGVPEIDANYLAKVGLTKLDLAITLLNSQQNGDGRDGIKAIRFEKNSIEIEVVNKDGKAESRDITDYSVRELRTMKPPRKHGQNQGSTDQESAPADCDLRTINDPAQLKTIAIQYRSERDTARKKVQKLEAKIENLESENSRLEELLEKSKTAEQSKSAAKPSKKGRKPTKAKTPPAAAQTSKDAA